MSAAEHVRRWLGRSQAGCSFASALAKVPGGLAFAEFEALAAPETLDKLFDYAAGAKKPALAVLPAVRTEPELAAQLVTLASGDRWRVRRASTPKGMTTDDVFVSVDWRTADASTWSSAMGLGPFGTMPATRRAPYTVIAAWTGTRENPFHKRAPHVGFLDVDLSSLALNRAGYDQLTKSSEALTSEAMFDDRPARYRKVAFRLSSAVAGYLSALPE